MDFIDYFKNVTFIRRSLTHNSWIQQLEILRQVVKDELAHSRKIRENLFAIRERAKNDMLEQHDLVEFYLRKRIFLTNKVKNKYLLILVKS